MSWWAFLGWGFASLYFVFLSINGDVSRPIVLFAGFGMGWFWALIWARYAIERSGL